MSRTRVGTTRVARVPWLGVLLVGVLALAGCASGSPAADPSSPPLPSVTDPAEVAAAVDAARQPLTWQLSAPAISVGAAQRGKSVAVITKDINPFIQAVTDGIGTAAGKAGMATPRSNPAASASDVSRQLSQAVAQRAAAIITVGFTTAEIAAPLGQASAAGIPVVQLFVTDPGPPPAEAAGAGVFGYVSPCYTCIGAAMASVVIHDSGGHASVVFVNAPDVGIAALEARGFTAELGKTCPGCTVKVADAPIAQWGTQIPAIAAAAAADRGVNYVVPVFDTATPLVLPALAAAGADQRIKLVSSNGDQAPLRDMRAGAAPRWVGNIGVNGEWIGWASMDQVFRALTGQPALPDEKIGFRTFTPANVGGLGLDGNPSSWYGDTDFAGQYLKLWGLS